MSHGRHHPRHTPSVADLIARERAAGLGEPAGYREFSRRLVESKCDILEFCLAARRDGKHIAGYGAPAKGNTMLNYCGIRPELISYTVDRSPHKQGLLLPGMRIPIFPPEEILRARPDYLLILPWNLREEVMLQMAAIREWGGKFVVPISAHSGVLMRIVATILSGVFVINAEKHEDERGSFARTFCAREFADAGLPVSFPQCNTSFNVRRGTFAWFALPGRALSGGATGALHTRRRVRRRRGHKAELVHARQMDQHRSERGNRDGLFDSAWFRARFPNSGKDATEIFYQISESYNAAFARGVRWNDRAFGIAWPIDDPIMSPRDASYPDVAREPS